MRRRGAILLSILLGLAAGPTESASLPPRFHFRSLKAERATIHFHDGLEALARQAASLSDEILVAHSQRYHVVVGRVQIVLADADDDPNGFATPLPYPLVWIRAAAPTGADDFGNYESWLRLVLTHELAHIVHLEQGRGLMGFGRKIFGRAPFLFPNTLTPTWMIEGLATYEETERTAFGRGRNPDSRMVRRMATLSGETPRQDRSTGGFDAWPGGQAPYLFGESFLRHVTAQYGPNALPEIARSHSTRPIPYLDDLTARRVTGQSFSKMWGAWVSESRAGFEGERREIEERGITPSRALTSRGVRQTAPRFSPDGAWVAYASTSLGRFPQIRIVRADGGADRKVVNRVGGSSLSWTPDGRAIVYDEDELVRAFEFRSDLRIVDVASRRVRRLTRDLRAREPDVAPDGRSVVFARRYADRTELATIGIEGGAARDITRSEPGVQWSHPRVSPDGSTVVAAKWSQGGLLDVALVDVVTGAVTELTSDRDQDVEPAWMPDGKTIVFRSSRDGVSNIYALRIADRSVFRVTNVLGGAFDPDVAADGRRLAFSSYTSAGYDVHVAAVDPAAGAPIAIRPSADAPASSPDPAPSTGDVSGYNPFAGLAPRFWSPFVEKNSGEWRVGAATGGLDALFRHAYAFDLHRGLDTRRFGFRAFYQYDRFRPTLLLTAEDNTDPFVEELGRVRTEKLTARISYPLVRQVRSSLSLVTGWRGERQRSVDFPLGEGRLGGVETALQFNSLKRYSFSISPVDGVLARVSYLKEDPVFGGDVSLGKLAADGRAYVRLGGGAVLAARAGGGITLDRERFRSSYAAGGFSDASFFDLIASRPSVLRGYKDDAFIGRRLAYGNLELRVPLAHPQRGLRSFPIFLRHVHVAAFLDAANVWQGDPKRGTPDRFRFADVKSSVGVALGADLVVFHVVPLTLSGGFAQGLGTRAERLRGADRLFFRTGLSF